MEQQNITAAILDLIERPAFCVRDGIIVQANQAAQSRQLTVGQHLADILQTPCSDGDALSVTILAAGIPCRAQVIRTNDTDIFALDCESTQLRAIALAAQHIRNPLNSVIALTEELSEGTQKSDLAQLQRGLHRLHRIVCNMSDAYRYQQTNTIHMETADITSIIDEVMEAISAYLSECAIKLDYSSASERVIGLCDREMLERAIYNLVSNAAKFMLPESTLEAKLMFNKNILTFSVYNRDANKTHASPFSRYLREPSIEDSRNGIGLGMELIRAAAAVHNGTVLVDYPEEGGTRVSMTLSVRSHSETTVRSRVILPTSNYAGDRDRNLLELSEILPIDSYKM